MSSFPAKYRGECGDCGDVFEKGTEVRYDDDNTIVHADPRDCTSAAGTSRNTRNCPSCHLLHAGECF